MRVASWLPVVIYLFSCASSALAQTSLAKVQSDVSKNYKILKEIIRQSMIKENNMGLYFPDAGTVDLYYCSYVGMLGLPIREKQDRTSNLADIAYDSLIYELSLPAVGYPRSVWGGMVSAHETRALSKGFQPFLHNEAELKSWAAKLNAYRAQSGKNIRKVVVAGGCGAGGTLAAFKTEPAGARVLLIPEMYYTFCQKQGIDADDDMKCNYWGEVHKGQKVEVSGKYKAKLVWADHSAVRNFSAAKLNDGDNYVTLR